MKKDVVKLVIRGMLYNKLHLSGGWQYVHKNGATQGFGVMPMAFSLVLAIAYYESKLYLE